MAWLCKDKDGIEVLFTTELKPVRHDGKEWGLDDRECIGRSDSTYAEFPEGTFTTCPDWEDEPIEI